MCPDVWSPQDCPGATRDGVECMGRFQVVGHGQETEGTAQTLRSVFLNQSHICQNIFDYILKKHVFRFFRSCFQKQQGKHFKWTVFKSISG